MMNGNHADRTVRLTTAQAIVKFLQAQWTEFDGQRERLFRGVFGLFGHGNVLGLGQALEEYGHNLAFYQAKNEQSAVHQAMGYAKAKDRLSTFACAASIGLAPPTWSPGRPLPPPTGYRCCCCRPTLSFGGAKGQCSSRSRT